MKSTLEMRTVRTKEAIKRMDGVDESGEKEIEESLNRNFKLMKEGKLKIDPNWLKPFDNDAKSVMYEDSDDLGKALDEALGKINNKRKVNEVTEFVKKSSGLSDEEFFESLGSKESELDEEFERVELEEEEHFETFGEMAKRLVEEQKETMIKSNQNTIKYEVNTMNNEELLSTALELCKADKISDADLMRIENKINKRVSLTSEIKMIKAKLGRRDYDDDNNYEPEESNPDHKDEDEYGEEEEGTKSKKKKKKKEPEKVEYESDMRSNILSEVNVLCKSNKITLNEAIQTEGCLNKGVEIPSRVADLIGIEYEDEDEEFLKADNGYLTKADLVTRNISSRTPPSKIVSHATGGESLSDEEEFNNYFFGLSKEEAIARITQLHVSGKITCDDVIRLEPYIRRGLKPPPEFKKFFEKGNWLM